MRFLCLLLLLLLSLPLASWAKTGPGQKSNLTPQQVQFMRWWRAQSGRGAKPAGKPIAKPVVTSIATPIAKPKLTVKVTRRSVKMVRINTKPRRPGVVPIHRTRLIPQETSGSSLLTLKAVLLKRRVVRRTERDGTQRKTTKQRPVRRAAKKSVIVQSPASEPPPPQPTTLTKLRYQLELAQME